MRHSGYNDLQAHFVYKANNTGGPGLGQACTWLLRTMASTTLFLKIGLGVLYRCLIL